MSMTISCRPTWTGQGTDQTTLDITRRVFMSVVYDCLDCKGLECMVLGIRTVACVGWQRPQLSPHSGM